VKGEFIFFPKALTFN